MLRNPLDSLRILTHGALGDALRDDLRGEKMKAAAVFLYRLIGHLLAYHALRNEVEQPVDLLRIALLMQHLHQKLRTCDRSEGREIRGIMQVAPLEGKAVQRLRTLRFRDAKKNPWSLFDQRGIKRLVLHRLGKILDGVRARSDG